MRTLIVEGDLKRAKEFAVSMHGSEAAARCIYSTTNEEAKAVLTADTSITKVCFHGSIMEDRGEGLLAIIRAIRRADLAEN